MSYLSRLVTVLLLGAFCTAADLPAASKSGKQTENPPAISELTEQDLEAVRALFGRLSELFKNGQAEECKALCVPEVSERIAAVLQREFGQSRYLEFEVVGEVEPDLSIPETKQHLVDVRLHYKIQSANGQTRDLENTVLHTFLLQEQRGRFLFVESAFFDGLGLRRGIWVMLGKALLGIIVGVALLSFWIWMGWEAYRARPRRYFWRLAVLVPLLGALMFFGVCYLPCFFRRSKPKPA